ncbi:MAG TPA: VWA domain-containing protein [Thermoanaerobaculia bacterium]|nr:VWA domain-containing protein [Thermoanaerobaculia bacterium]
MSGALLHNLLLFGRVLRGVGIDVNPGRMIDLVSALDLIDIGRRPDFYHATRSLLVHRRDDLARFDIAFDLFWQQRDPLTRPSARVIGELPPRPQTFAPPLPGRPAAETSEGSSDTPPSVETRMTYSDHEILRRKDFGEMTPAELTAIRSMMQQIVWRVSTRRTRRLRPGHGALVDLRRTVRRNLRYGGELLDWAEREPKVKPRPLVIIADVSGSMERYTRLLLLFTYGLAQTFGQKVEAFVFSTRLTRITRHLEQRNLDRALAEVARAVPDWSGGTRIGEALHSFNFDWGRRVLGHGALTLVISDGWDRGDISLLREEIARLQRNSRRLIWLNPLLGAPDYEPLTRGIEAALPFIDDFLPVHNLDSLDALARHLARLSEHRPERRQQISARRGALRT